MTLHSYYSNSGKDLILDYINNLPEEEKIQNQFEKEHQNQEDNQVKNLYKGGHEKCHLQRLM